MIEPAVHVVIPDTQVKPSSSLKLLEWIGRYLTKYDGHPNLKVIHLGDHWDMQSISSHSTKLEREGLRYHEDVTAGNDGILALNEPLDLLNKARRKKWKPERHLLRGNHEERITRYVSENPEFAGTISLDHLKSPGWVTHDFLEPVALDNVFYAHYWYNTQSGRPIGGGIDNRLSKLGFSFVQGHQQVKLLGSKVLNNGRTIRGLVCGSCYLEPETYRGPQAAATEWAGIFILNQVEDGDYCLMEISADYLCRRFEKKRLADWMAA